jgi:Penicillin amidase
LEFGNRGRAKLVVGVIAALVATPAASVSAAPTDHAETALNIIPSGQYGSVPAPPEADAQAMMYDRLTPLFDRVATSDLTTYFKSEGFGVGPDGPGSEEQVPRPGVTIIRDRFNVPHVTAQTYDDGIWAAGWIAAADRSLLGEQARYNARAAAVDIPGVQAIDLVRRLQNFQPSPELEAELAKQTDVLLAAGSEGEAVLHDIDTFIQGINDWTALYNPSAAPWTRNDLYALNALKGQFLGQGGGGEARRSQFLGGLIQRLGRKKGMSVFDDLSQFKNSDSPVNIDGKFKYGHIPKRAEGSVILDPDSFESTPAVPGRLATDTADTPLTASNTLMVDGAHSTTGNPLMVGGPQIGYFYPGLTWEIDMDAPGLTWRGATSAPFPGYLLIGRGEDFANTLTSAGGDIIDQFVEKLCNGSDQMYVYEGECLPMENFNAGTLNGEPVNFQRTVHGPVVGYATVNGERVAISSKRSSYGRDILDQLFFRRLSTGRVDSPKSFFKAASKSPQTFNSFYIDHKNIAAYVSGLLPIRDKKVDPRLPTWGTGQFEWTGFLSDKKHPQETNPRNGTMVNWNNGSAHGFAAADNDWGRNGIAQRVDLLTRNMRRLATTKGKWDLAALVSAMNAGATQDIRAIDMVPLLRRLLRGTEAPSPMAQQMLDLLIQWRANGGSRLDGDGDGLIDDPGAAIMDAASTPINNAFMGPVLGPQLDELNSLFPRFDAPPGGQFSGWYQYFARDIPGLLKMPIENPFRVSYCGGGSKKACQQSIWAAIQEAGESLTASEGTADPAAWRASAEPERISFQPGILSYTMHYTNRPSGIQQVISFGSHE